MAQIVNARAIKYHKHDYARGRGKAIMKYNSKSRNGTNERKGGFSIRRWRFKVRLKQPSRLLLLDSALNNTRELEKFIKQTRFLPGNSSADRRSRKLLLLATLAREIQLSPSAGGCSFRGCEKTAGPDHRITA